MKQLIKFFTPSKYIEPQRTVFEQKILSSSLFSASNMIQMGDILFLIEGFEGFGVESEEIVDNQRMKEFFKLCNEQFNGLISVKLCLALHLILYEFQVGDQLANSMLKYSLPKSPPDDIFYKFTQNYTVYLLKIAQGLRIFYSAKVGQYPIMDLDQNLNTQAPNQNHYLELQKKNFKYLRNSVQFGANNQYFQNYQQEQLQRQMPRTTSFITNDQKSLVLFKLHNLTIAATQVIRQAIEILSIFEQTKNTEYSNLLIEISCVLWNDIMVMYKFSCQEISRLLDIFRNVDQDTLISIQQLYISMTSLTENIRWIYNNKNIFDVQKIVRRPFWFEDNPKLSQELQNSIIDLKVKNIPLTAKVRKEPQSPSSIQQPFSAKNPSLKQLDSQYFISRKTVPLPPKSPKEQKTIVFPNQVPSPTDKKIIFKQLSGGLFEDDCEYMSPRGMTKDFYLESAFSNKESTGISNKKNTSLKK